jgi:stage II sporulation protein AA (anti-sigma F factor antagonist)
MTVAPVLRDAKVIDLEQHGDTIVLVPTVNLQESDYERIEEVARDIFELLDSRPFRNIILDFSQMDFYGSTALGLFLRLWKRARKQDGQLIFCNISDHEREILEVAHLDHLWRICSSRSEALQAVQE